MFGDFPLETLRDRQPDLCPLEGQAEPNTNRSY